MATASAAAAVAAACRDIPTAAPHGKCERGGTAAAAAVSACCRDAGKSQNFSESAAGLPLLRVSTPPETPPKPLPKTLSVGATAKPRAVQAAAAAAAAHGRAADGGGRGGKADIAMSESASQRTVRVLKEKGRKAKKWLGQHYMVDEEVTRQTVRVADVQPGDVVLEVGPGTGALTEHLLNAGAFVVAVEKDPDMVDITKERFGSCPNLEVIHADITRFHVENHIKNVLQRRATALPYGHPPQRAKVVANLPFNITTEFLRRVLPLGEILSTVVLMLQDEAAKRLLEAGPGSPDYRRVNVFLQYFSEPEYSFFVDRRKFLPPPKFHAAIVKLDVKRPQQCLPVSSVPGFLRLVDGAFATKRKMLRSSLKVFVPPDSVEAALVSLGLPPTSRPEDLDLHQFVNLYEELARRARESRNSGQTS